MASNMRARSPARVGVRTTPTKTGLATKVNSSRSPRVMTERVNPRAAGRGQAAGFMEPDSGYQRKLKNTPEHLYGVDKADDILDDDAFFRGKKEIDVKQMKEETCGKSCSNDPGAKWYQKSWMKMIGLILMILIAMQAFLYLKERNFKFDDSNLSADASICLRSHEELRKKLALAFELINESGKLFKQLERQTKHEFNSVDAKINNYDSKNIKELEVVKRQIEALKVTQIQRDNVDFSRYADKELPVDLSEVHSLIEMALLQYDADKIGIPDYALESAGGTIHVPYHSQTHSSGSPIMKVFGIIVWQDTRTPREIIKPETLPGNCWPLKGSSGYVVIKLALPIIPSMVTMEHMHPSLAKFSDETWQSIPQNFTVYGWVDGYGKEKVTLGSYVYVQGSKARQTFPVQVTPDQLMEYVELQIESNYGNPDYTCLYRFRVHGNPLQASNTHPDME